MILHKEFTAFVLTCLQVNVTVVSHKFFVLNEMKPVHDNRWLRGRECVIRGFILCDALCLNRENYIEDGKDWACKIKSKNLKRKFKLLPEV